MPACEHNKYNPCAYCAVQRHLTKLADKHEAREDARTVLTGALLLQHQMEVLGRSPKPMSECIRAVYANLKATRALIEKDKADARTD